MLDTILEIVKNEAFVSFVFVLIGVLLKTFAPAWLPVLGSSKKLVSELLEVLDKSNEENISLLKKARMNEKKQAAKYIEKHLNIN